MPTARVVINSPTTHGAIGFSTDLAPSMTLGCGSWGGNVTSDNISPHHLMDIKRVAFETKPVNKRSAISDQHSAARGDGQVSRKTPKREDIAAIVDSFFSKKLAEAPLPEPVKTIVHEITAENAVQKPVPITPADFVSEDDVRRAIASGDKIYISKKTILTPSARDLGDEKEVFANV